MLQFFLQIHHQFRGLFGKHCPGGTILMNPATSQVWVTFFFWTGFRISLGGHAINFSMLENQPQVFSLWYSHLRAPMYNPAVHSLLQSISRCLKMTDQGFAKPIHHNNRFVDARTLISSRERFLDALVFKKNAILLSPNPRDRRQIYHPCANQHPEKWLPILWNCETLMFVSYTSNLWEHMFDFRRYTNSPRSWFRVFKVSSKVWVLE